MTDGKIMFPTTSVEWFAVLSVFHANLIPQSPVVLWANSQQYPLCTFVYITTFKSQLHQFQFKCSAFDVISSGSRKNTINSSTSYWRFVVLFSCSFFRHVCTICLESFSVEFDCKVSESLRPMTVIPQRRKTFQIKTVLLRDRKRRIARAPAWS